MTDKVLSMPDSVLLRRTPRLLTESERGTVVSSKIVNVFIIFGTIKLKRGVDGNGGQF